MSAPVWFPLARRVVVGNGSGAMLGGPPRAIHHTTEGGSIDGAVSTYRQTHNYPTFTIDYAADDVVQHLPVTTAATAVQNASGGVQTNRYGSVCIQIEWIGTATKPFTRDAKGNLLPAGPKVRAFFDFLRSWGIPDVWPMGAPLAYPGSYGVDNGDRDPEVWAAKGGHYGHSQVPENHHGDPGAIHSTFVKQTAVVKAQTTVSPSPLTELEQHMYLAIDPNHHTSLVTPAGVRELKNNAEKSGFVKLLSAKGGDVTHLTAAEYSAVVAVLRRPVQ